MSTLQTQEKAYPYTGLQRGGDLAHLAYGIKLPSGSHVLYFLRQQEGLKMTFQGLT
jgi:hypothetical protein